MRYEAGWHLVGGAGTAHRRAAAAAAAVRCEQGTVARALPVATRRRGWRASRSTQAPFDRLACTRGVEVAYGTRPGPRCPHQRAAAASICRQRVRRGVGEHVVEHYASYVGCCTTQPQLSLQRACWRGGLENACPPGCWSFGGCGHSLHSSRVGRCPRYVVPYVRVQAAASGCHK